MNAVPDAYLGVWRRTLLTTAAGVRDTATEVYWLQTARLFADLRIPRPAPASAVERAAQAGFAGVTEVNGDTCQWHRAIDFQPPRGRDDIGRMCFETPDRLLEDGLEGSYHEVWERLPESAGRNRGAWLAAPDGRQGCLLLAGDCFLFAAGRPWALPPASSLAALLVEGGDGEALLGFELSFGRHGGGLHPWCIALSTLPGRAGQALLPATADPDDEALFAQAGLASLGAVPALHGWRLRSAPVFDSGGPIP